jgi:hypothetical protein
MATPRRFDRRRCLVTGSGVLLTTLFDPGLTLAAPDELAVIVHPSNSAQITIDDIAAVFKTTMRFWSGSKRIVPLNLPPRTPGRLLFDRVVLGMDADTSFRYWIDRKIRGGEPAPRSVPEPELVIRIVQKLETAIGYAPANLVTSGVRVVARVRSNGVEKVAVLAADGGSR